tara:strand:- start:1605 stop:2327 length:723 start_codon:yes stop_codon:yes gene_type:complete
MHKILVLTPFYNESHNLKNFEKLINNFKELDIDFKFVFCNDNSSDDSPRKLKLLLSQHRLNYEIFNNSKNLGHGKSLVQLSKTEEITDFDFVLTLDFDFGYFFENLRIVLNELKMDTIFIGERKNFDEGLFRQFITSVSELIIVLKTFTYFHDTNCPIRIYPTKVFLEIWKKIPKETLIPNIFGTYLVIKKSYKFQRFNLIKDETLSSSPVSWGSNILLKKVKILKFSIKSMLQIAKFKN